ncbi:hypothetical protein MXI84_001841 [Escherichia coli]|nr:hypothetical protein [Escherichia coli]EJB9953509.1 hypothetical protein [Escherichia coli]EJB9973713.1 hypothetical protein [Escherichia coli]EJE4972093.1 hypothetical protein [Escherichia coli]HCN8834469.1 hypothetical protein [Escherichia coli]
MPMPAPQLAYDTGTRPVVAHGLSYDDEQVSEILAGPVKDILQDTAGSDELQELLGSVVSTEFEQDGLRELLADDTVPNNWRVGEAIAEAFVADKGSCVFPWPTGRDLKNPNASPAGCDLTGFQPVDDEELPYRFAFGEVKTSEHNQSPPSVMTSLGGQLQGLRDNRQVKDALCRYLGHHAARADWELMYKSAAKRYLSSNTTDVAVYGVLVRDIAPNTLDISGRARALAANCPAQTDIEMYALYLPLNAISSLSDRAQAAMQEAS